MPEKLSNKEIKNTRKKFYADQRAKLQASIDACKDKRERNRIAREIKESERRKELYNLCKPMVIVFTELGGRMIISTIVDPILIGSTFVTGNRYHLVYGAADYTNISTTASYNSKGNRTERKGESYTVSTDDGINFKVNHMYDIEKTVFSFKSSIKYENIVGTYENVEFGQAFFSPKNLKTDRETRMIHAQLLQLIENDKKYHWT